MKGFDEIKVQLVSFNANISDRPNRHVALPAPRASIIRNFACRQKRLSASIERFNEISPSSAAIYARINIFRPRSLGPAQVYARETLTRPVGKPRSLMSFGFTAQNRISS